MAGSAERTWIALFRGINVGGRNRLPMAELRELMESLGFADVRSYIQSGNLVFTASGSRESLARKIGKAVQDQFGFSPEVMLLEAGELAGIERRNPFPEAVDEPKSLHVWFLESSPHCPDFDRMNEMCAPGERFELGDREFFLYAPDGIGRSKLVANVEKCLGVAGTARNWRTVEKLLEMAAA